MTARPLIATAPMVDWTDRHCLYLFSLLAPKATLYTEMIVDKAIIHGDHAKLLQHDIANQHIILQLGGSNPAEMAAAVKIAEDYDYTGYNINVGCPSSRVQSGAFGACLMAEPQTVAHCFKAMQQQTDKPISIKTRLGIDDQDDDAFLYKFIETTANAGCKAFTIHARKALLKGLSPKQNRDIPPLQYERVYQLKQQFPELHITINGGIKTLADTQQHLKYVDGVMMGRLAYQQPYEFAKICTAIYGNTLKSRAAILMQYITYIKTQPDIMLHVLTKPLMGLYHGQPNGKKWRQLLGERMHLQEFIEKSLPYYK